MMGKQICTDEIFWHDVGQNPQQGNLQSTTKLDMIPITKVAGDELGSKEKEQIIQEIEAAELWK